MRTKLWYYGEKQPPSLSEIKSRVKFFFYHRLVSEKSACFVGVFWVEMVNTGNFKLGAYDCFFLTSTQVPPDGWGAAPNRRPCCSSPAAEPSAPSSENCWHKGSEMLKKITWQRSIYEMSQTVWGWLRVSQGKRQLCAIHFIRRWLFFFFGIRVGSD